MHPDSIILYGAFSLIFLLGFIVVVTVRLVQHRDQFDYCEAMATERADDHELAMAYTTAANRIIKKVLFWIWTFRLCILLMIAILVLLIKTYLSV